MVKHGRLSGLAFDEYQFERWLGDREVGVAGTSLSRFDPEEPPVELDRTVQICHPQRQLNSRHHSLLDSIFVELQVFTVAPWFDTCQDRAMSKQGGFRWSVAHL
jgi:hypothetical protein